MSNSPINLIEPTTASATRILQLYDHLELFSEGEPPQNTLFVLERASLSVVGDTGDRLLIIDPPPGALRKFRLEGAITSICTGEVRQSGLPQMQTMPGGVAHVRMGEHFLDIYTQRNSNIVYFPALAILCGGAFASDASLPALAPGSDGSEELDTLRLLAQLVKRRLQLYIPQVGSLIEDSTSVMQRLAEDVHYLHGLRRIVPGLAQRGDALEDVWQVAESLLPSTRRTEALHRTHQANVQAVWACHTSLNLMPG